MNNWNPNQPPPGYPQPGQATPGYPAPAAAPQGPPPAAPGYAPPAPQSPPNWGQPMQAPPPQGPPPAPYGAPPPGYGAPQAPPPGYGAPAPYGQQQLPPPGYGPAPGGYAGPGAGQPYAPPAAPAALPPPAKLESNEPDLPFGTHVFEVAGASVVANGNLFILPGTIVQSNDPNIRPGTQGAFKRPLSGQQAWMAQKASEAIAQAVIALQGKTAQEANLQEAGQQANELVQSAYRGAPTIAGRPVRGMRCVIVVAPRTRPRRDGTPPKMNPATGQPYPDVTFYPLPRGG